MTHLRGYRADAALIPEPEDEKLVRANTGVLWFQVIVRGHAVHVRDMDTGSNAIDAAWRVVGALRALEAELNAEKSSYPLFVDEAKPINLNIGKIEGGDWASSVPSWCRLDCRLALFPGVSAESVAKRVTETVAAFSRSDPFLANSLPEVTFNGFYSEGYVLEPGSDAEAVLGNAHRTAFGSELESFITAGYLDARVYALYDEIPTLCYGHISENIHGVDERASISSIRKVTKAMALFVAEWCGVMPKSG